MDPIIESFITSYVQALRDHNAAVFAGAGLSIPAGLVDWKELLRGIASDIGLDVDREQDLVSVAQFHVNESAGGRHSISQALINEFALRAKVTTNHRALTSLPIRTYWTTNYDDLIEEALKDAKKTPDVKRTVASLAHTLPRRDAVVYKMHGDVSLPEEAVVTKDDYEAYDSTRHLFSVALQGDLVSKTFLFIGFSFSDPNLSYILSRIRLLLGENRRNHYCLMRRVQASDFISPSEYLYARARQDLQVRDLRRYGIVGLLVDDYSAYTQVLARVAQRYRLGRVFISGSAADYGDWEYKDGVELIQMIAARLIQEKYSVVSGFGMGVGPFVINGVLNQLDRQQTRLLDDYIVLRPFPQGGDDPDERTKRWEAYREDMIEQAGIAVFLFGNTRDRNGNSALSDGVEREFEIASARGLRLVPIGSTGSQARILHQRILNDFDRYYPDASFRPAFEELAKIGGPSEVVERTFTFLRRLTSNSDRGR